MSDPDLTRLKETPPPRDAAKRAALAAAMVAFDQAEQKNESETQGTAEPIRLKDASSRTEGKKTMRASQFNYALAASIAALMIAAPAAFMLSRSGGKQATYSGVTGNLTDGSGAGYSPAPAAASRSSDELAKAESEHRNEASVVAPAPMIARGETAKSAAPAVGGNGQLADDAEGKRAKIADGKSSDLLWHSPMGPLRFDHAIPTNKSPKDITQKFRFSGGTNFGDAAPVAANNKPRTEPARKRANSSGDLFAFKPGAAQPDNYRAPESLTSTQAGDQAVGAGSGSLYGLQGSVPASPKSKEAAGAVVNGRMTQESMAQSAADMLPPPVDQEFRDKFDAKEINPVKQVAQEPVSTFSIDVDTASYAFARRMINYFPYNYPKPDSAETPFRPTITVTPSPWNAGNRLVHVALQGYELHSAQRPRANLVFLVDVSGSMAEPDKLPLVKNALRMLVDELRPQDTVSLVTYASGSGVALEPTPISEKHKIVAAIDALGAGGSTAGAQGIQDAYRLAETHFDKSGVNRVILATDGDFNVGVTDQGELKGLIERKREKGIFLSILGVGQGNYNDSLMQTLAQNGNGTAAYVDTLNEARKVLVDEASSTIFPIAKDVKIQVEWNPSRVSEYRLIGYETRALKREDFNNDRVDAGDVGSGHRVTAIYEITPVDSDRKLVDDLRYNPKPAELRVAPAAGSPETELGFLKLRYKLPKEEKSKLISQPIGDAQSVASVEKAPEDVRFSIAVAAFGQLLKGAPYLTNYSYDDVAELARGAKGDDRFGYRTEFVNLVRLAKSARP